MNTPGQQTVAATLDAIDAATQQRCACGCGARLADDGPSAWFASEACQWSWASRRVDEYPDNDPFGGFFAAMAEQMAAAQRDMIERLFGIAASALGVDPWPTGAQQVRLYTGSGHTEIGTLTPDPNGDVTMASGRYAFEPANLCSEHAHERADQAPTDPMERALWLRRNRNTGPRPRQRAPRRIDPRRSR